MAEDFVKIVTIKFTKNTMGKIIILGATGLVGAYTAIDLKEKGYDVVAVGRRICDNGFFEEHGISYYSVDVTRASDFQKLPGQNVEAIVHLAGAMPAAMEGYNPHTYVYTILDGTLNVLEYAQRCSARKIIFAQSRADSNYLMGKKPIPSDIVKKFPLKGDHSVYSICKNAAVDLIEHFYYQYGLKRFVLRFTTVYGYHPNPYFHVNGVKKIMAYRYVMEKAMKGEPVEIWGNPNRAKEIVYIKDVVQVIRKCVEATIDGGMYNIGRGVGVTLEEQIRGIVEVFSPQGHPSPIVYRPEKPDACEYVNDISKTVHELGYAPEYDYHKLLVDFKRNMEEEPMKQLWGVRADYE